MARKKLSDLKATLSDLHDISMTTMPHGDWLIFRSENGDILFSVKSGDIFDADGMYFEENLS